MSDETFAAGIVILISVLAALFAGVDIKMESSDFMSVESVVFITRSIKLCLYTGRRGGVGIKSARVVWTVWVLKARVSLADGAADSS
jgi:hypothetical protein